MVDKLGTPKNCKKKQEHFRILDLRYSHENIPAGLKKIFI